MRPELRAELVVAQRYRLIRELGFGGYGVVWQAQQLDQDRFVAIKFLTSGDPDAVLRFQVEARVLAQLKHENLVTLYDFALEPTPFIVTDFFDGATLTHWATERPRSTAALTSVIRQIAGALRAAHDAGVIHRDLKPANILVRDTTWGPQVKVLDFGLAKIIEGRQGDITKTGEVWGSAGYMSPEQLKGMRDITTSTDLYCLGVVMFELLEGSKPFVGATNVALGMKHLLEPAPPMSGGVPFGELVSRLMAKDPAQRPAISDVIVELDRHRMRGNALVGFATVAGLTAGLLIAAVVWSASTETAPQPDVVAQPPIAARESAPMIETPAIEQDADIQHDASVVEPADCSGYAEIQPGPRSIKRIEGLSRKEFLVHVPRDYDPAKQYPVALVFHDGFQGPVEALQVLKPLDNGFADYVLIFPEDRSVTKQWKLASTIESALSPVDDTAEELCIDHERIFALGMGAGGLAAERMLCEHPAVVAIAATSHRQNMSDPKCEPDDPSPYLFISATQDPLEPIEGGPDCAGGTKWSLERHVDWLKTHFGCEGAETETSQTDISRCVSWSCGTRFESCVVEGGRVWPGDPRLSSKTPLELLVDCRSTAANFDYGAKISAFFTEVEASADTAEAP